MVFKCNDMTMTIRRKQFLLGMLVVLAVAVVGTTTYWAVRPRPQQVTSRADSSCDGEVRIELTENSPVQVGNKIYPKLYSYLNSEPLGMAAVTINYDPNLVELDRKLIDSANLGNQDLLISAANYDHDPNLDTETSAVFELPDVQKLHVLASCKYVENDAGEIRCDPNQNVWGEDLGGGVRKVLLAALPLKVKDRGEINLTFQNVECGAESTQSVVLGASTGLELSGDKLGTAAGVSFCGMDVNLNGSTNENGDPTITALDFREWLVYFKDYITEGNFAAAADFNCDSKINALDFSVFLREFRKHL